MPILLSKYMAYAVICSEDATTYKKGYEYRLSKVFFSAISPCTVLRTRGNINAVLLPFPYHNSKLCFMAQYFAFQKHLNLWLLSSVHIKLDHALSLIIYTSFWLPLWAHLNFDRLSHPCVFLINQNISGLPHRAYIRWMITVE